MLKLLTTIGNEKNEFQRRLTVIKQSDKPKAEENIKEKEDALIL